MNNHSVNIFSTSIWGYVLAGQKYNIKEYIEYILNLYSNSPTVSKSNAGGGWQSTDNLHENSIFHEFANDILINEIAANILKEYNVSDYKVQSMWANVNQKHSFNYHHTHEGYLSGVFYLQVPPNSGRLVFTNPNIRSELHPIRCKNYLILPEPLACIVFPSWLEHYVEPSNSDELRISISFNVGN